MGMNRCLFVVRKTNICAIMDIIGLRGGVGLLVEKAFRYRIYPNAEQQTR
ncbi:helix-turn-helix domain-containing protein, partial [Cohnella sp.]